MGHYRCPDPSHADVVVPLKSNNDRVQECPALHKYWRREEEGKVLLVNLITQEQFPAVTIQTDTASDTRPRLNFMVDVPRVLAGLDFDNLTLSAIQWKVISRIDGTSNLEEVRLLGGLTPADAEQAVHELIEAGLIEVRRRGGR